MKCEVCNDREGIHVCATSIPCSASFCDECLKSGAEPYWIIVANTACIGGIENAADWWKKIVDVSLKWHGKSYEDLNKDVIKSEEEMYKHFAETEVL